MHLKLSLTSVKCVLLSNSFVISFTQKKPSLSSEDVTDTNLTSSEPKRVNASATTTQIHTKTFSAKQVSRDSLIL